MSSKTILIEWLRTNAINRIDFSQLLVIVNQQTLTLYEARRFLLSKYPSLDFDWSTFSDVELKVVA
jgi:hypothetical protein